MKNLLLAALLTTSAAPAFAEQPFLVNQWMLSNSTVSCQYSDGTILNSTSAFCQQTFQGHQNQTDYSIPLQVKPNSFTAMDMLQLQNQLLQNQLLQRQLQQAR